uniref:Uncharacterized protein n=1 Tax=Medicago truncatula TaxID=3880 RepID=I3S4D7_MEDTR|nr:unknown [Medicago truncatula]
MGITKDSWSLILQLTTLSRALKNTTHQHYGFSIMNQHTTFDPIDFMTQYLAIETLIPYLLDSNPASIIHPQ